MSDLVTEFARGHFFLPSLLSTCPNPREGDEGGRHGNDGATPRRLRAGPSGLVALVYIRPRLMNGMKEERESGTLRAIS